LLANTFQRRRCAIPGNLMFPIRRSWTALLALAVSTLAALGAETAPTPFTYTDINTVVPGHPELRYSDLLRQLVPDLRLNETIATGTAPIQPIPHVMGKPFVAHFDTTVSFASFQTRTIEAEGANRLLILTPVGLRTNPDDPMLLLAFSDDATPKLLDVMDVSMGDTVTIGQPLRIGDKDQAIVTTSDYTADGQTQSADTLLFMRNGKFDAVGGFERTQTLDVVAQKPRGTGPYDDIKVTINDIGRPLKDSCAQPVGLSPYTDQYSALYRWNAATGFFDGDTSQIDKLKDLNDTRR
jgi:hypothetical protein